MEENQTKEGLEKIYEESVKDLKEGQLVKGKIVGLTDKDILIDVGYKSEGAIPRGEFPNSESLKVGDPVDVLLESLEDETGRVRLSKWKADRSQGWEKLSQISKEGDVVEGRVTKKVKGGLMMDVAGTEAFLPASLVALKGYANLDQFINQTLKTKIVKINKLRRNIVVSRRDYLIEEKKERQGKLVGELQKDKVLKGTVKNITDFGAFIDLGGMDGLLHITDMSWGRIAHPSEMLTVGDEIQVMILDFNKETMKVSLGLKQLTPSPWKEAAGKYPAGTRVKGKVTSIMPYGAFVEVERGIEGLVHISELSWTRRVTNPNEVLAIGDVVEAVVLTVDSERQKLALGIRQTETNPWKAVAEKYPVGTKVHGKVHNLTEYGAFIELEDGIEGLLHVSDLSWTRKVNNPKDLLKKGQKIDVVVLSVDVENKKIALGLKQLAPDPWPDIASKYPIGVIAEGTIAKVTNFGVFVELEQDIEGLAHISELPIEPNTNIEARYKSGERVKVRIIKLDESARKIGLSMKGDL